MKYFLILAGQRYYPQWITREWIAKDWHKAYETLEEAQNQVKEIPNRYGDEGNSYQIDGHTYDWYTIVDLREWI